jgi:hypothetical protein
LSQLEEVIVMLVYTLAQCLVMLPFVAGDEQEEVTLPDRQDRSCW